VALPPSQLQLECAALSLPPISWWRVVSERLRAGARPGLLLGQLIAERSRERIDTASVLRSRALTAVRRAADLGIACVAWSDIEYPSALAAISDPPPVLWVRGVINSLSLPSVAIVGSRAGSAYACSVAERLAADLAARQVVVVSGLARGVDAAAHEGALSVGGTTIAVLGSGADVVYPREHTKLADAIAREGAVVSELEPGTPPRPMFFPQRNRIISGLARAVVVVEAGDRSGSLITARFALEQGRDVLAVPGNVLSGRNRGGHRLLRDGAKIVETADDILEELDPGLLNPRPPAEASNDEGAPRQAVDDPVLHVLTRGDPLDLDAIADRTGWSTARLLPRLFELELQGVVRRVGGGRFLRI